MVSVKAGRFHMREFVERQTKVLHRIIALFWSRAVQLSLRGDPFEVEAGEGQVGVGPVAFALDFRPVSAAFVKAEHGAIGQDGEVAVGTGAGLERPGDGPGFAVVAAEVDRHIAPGGVLAVGGVWMGEKQ